MNRSFLFFTGWGGVEGILDDLTFYKMYGVFVQLKRHLNVELIGRGSYC